ncbi:MAG: glucosaminidase domain-containing protein [Clostridia bacterium]|nr:glucosaminidase domain-containing protein [Clostridia bacterium]
MQIITADQAKKMLTPHDGGYRFNHVGQVRYMTDDSKPPVTLTKAEEILTKLAARIPLNWLSIPIFLLPYSLRQWDKVWGQSYIAEVFATHMIVGAGCDEQTFVHELGHVFAYRFLDADPFDGWDESKYAEYKATRGLTSDDKDWYYRRPGEVFAEDFRYLLGFGPWEFDEVPPPEPVILDFILGFLIGGNSMSLADVDLRKPSGVSARTIDKFLAGTPLAGLGKAFILAEQQWAVSARYLTAHAVLESGWGRSKIAQDKHNLYGFQAYDSSPYASARAFPSFEECIKYVAQYVARNYLNPDGKYCNGPSLRGMNKRYATDQKWADKIASLMRKIELEEEKPVADKKEVFSDIKGHWAHDIIVKAKELGLMSGYPDGTFQPDKPVTRAELAAAQVKMFEKIAEAIQAVAKK